MYYTDFVAVVHLAKFEIIKIQLYKSHIQALTIFFRILINFMNEFYIAEYERIMIRYNYSN